MRLTGMRGAWNGTAKKHMLEQIVRLLRIEVANGTHLAGRHPFTPLEELSILPPEDLNVSNNPQYGRDRQVRTELNVNSVAEGAQSWNS